MTKVVRVLSLAGLAFAAAPAIAQDQSPDEVRAVVAEMLADAESRTSLLAADGTAGYDKGFFLGSADGDFRLNISGVIQFRYNMGFRDDDNNSGGADGDDFTTGFQTRRTKLRFAGKMHKDWSFAVMADFSRSNGTAGLQDAYVDYSASEHWKIRFGQAKIPLLREELVSDQNQLAAERSLVNAAFTQDRSQMIQASYEGDPIVFRAAFSDGINSDNTDYPNAAGPGVFAVSGTADWAVTGRLEYLLSGSESVFKDMTAEPGQAFSALLGGAVHYQQSPNTNGVGDLDRNVLEYTADLSLEGGGWNGYAAFVGRNDDFRSGGGDTEFDDFGVVVQGGFRVAEKWEPFARWEAFFLDEDRGLDEDTHHFVTVGVNYYIAGQALRMTADCVFSFDDTVGLIDAGLLPNSGVGLLGSDEDGEVLVRLQFQMLF